MHFFVYDLLSPIKRDFNLGLAFPEPGKVEMFNNYWLNELMNTQ